MVEEFGLDVEPLVGLARIVRGADTGKLESKGVAVACLATPATSAGGTNSNTAPGSTKRRMSQGQATRATFGRARLTQTVRPSWSRRGILEARTAAEGTGARRRRHLQGFELQDFRSQAAATASLDVPPLWHSPTMCCPAYRLHQGFKTGGCVRMRAGNELRTEIELLLRAHRRAPGSPTRRESCATVISVRGHGGVHLK